MAPVAARRLSLVLTIAGVSIMSAFLLRVAADRSGSAGLTSFVNYTLGGSST